MSHNPTGVDFTKEQWKKISLICQENTLYPFFDSAYQGLAASLEDDVWPIRFFIEEGHKITVAHSYSKNFSIYDERVGALFISGKDEIQARIIDRNLMKIARVSIFKPSLSWCCNSDEYPSK